VPSWLLPISYPTRANGIIVALNSQPRIMLFSSNCLLGGGEPKKPSMAVVDLVITLKFKS